MNESDWFFTVPDEGHIRYGLGAVKGVGEQVVEEIMRVRKEKGPFKDLFDFTARVKGMSARVLENLIKAGSFDSLDEDRGKLFGNIQHALNLGRAEQENDTQDSLFGDMEEEVERQVQWVDAPSWSDRERLVNEKKMLGFCFTGTPLRRLRARSTTLHDHDAQPTQGRSGKSAPMRRRDGSACDSR